MLQTQTILKHDGPNHFVPDAFARGAAPFRRLLHPDGPSIAHLATVGKKTARGETIAAGRTLLGALRDGTRSASPGKASRGGGRCRGPPQHGLSSDTMARIASVCGAMRPPEHQVALITSGCVRQGAAVAVTAEQRLRAEGQTTQHERAVERRLAQGDAAAAEPDGRSCGLGLPGGRGGLGWPGGAQPPSNSNVLSHYNSTLELLTCWWFGGNVLVVDHRTQHPG